MEGGVRRRCRPTPGEKPFWRSARGARFRFAQALTEQAVLALIAGTEVEALLRRLSSKADPSKHEKVVTLNLGISTPNKKGGYIGVDLKDPLLFQK